MSFLDVMGDIGKWGTSYGLINEVATQGVKGISGLASGGGGGVGTGLFSTGYDATAGMPNYMQGSDAAGLQQAQGAQQNNMAQQQAFLNALQGVNWNNNQANVFGQQQGLANQLQAQANGQGPNPAQAQLAMNTGQNTQQQAALMNSARGAQSNPGLIGRQAAIQGGNIQQQSAGQAAVLGAQQQLSAQQQLAQQQNQMANLSTAGLDQQQTGLSQLNQQSLAYQQMMQQALTSQNQQRVQTQLGNVPLAEAGMKNTAGGIGGIFNAVGGGFGLMGQNGKAHGGIIRGYASGGVTTPADNPLNTQRIEDARLPKSILGQYSSGEGAFGALGSGGSGGDGSNPINSGLTNLGTGVSKYLKSGSANSGALDLAGTDASLDSGGLYGLGDFGSAAGGAGDAVGGVSDIAGIAGGAADAAGAVSGVADIGAGGAAVLASRGGSVRGKAKVKGDSPKNDTVPAMLSPGEIVIPRSHVSDPQKIASFLNGLLGTNFQNVSRKTA